MRKTTVKTKDLAIKNDMRELEQFYSDGKIDNMLEKIEQEKEKVVNEMIEFANERRQAIRFDRYGEPIEYGVKANPVVISEYFFKPIVPIGVIEPEYNAEKLSMVFDYYCYLIAQVNDKIGNYPMSLTNFARFAGITLTSLRRYRNNSDLNMRIIVEKIYDMTSDTNINMSQLGMVNERSTIFKMKTQNELVEKEQPKINVNIVEEVDKDYILGRMEYYKQFANKKDNNE